MSRRRTRPTSPRIEPLERRELLHGGSSEPVAGLLRVVDGTHATPHRTPNPAIPASAAPPAGHGHLAVHSSAKHAAPTHHKNHYHLRAIVPTSLAPPIMPYLPPGFFGTAIASASGTPIGQSSTPPAAPAAVPSTPASPPAPVASPPTTVASPPVAAAPPTASAPAVATPSSATVIPIGTTFTTQVHPGGLSGPGVAYTIAPQPLPANVTFDATTGAIAFDPTPGQVGDYPFVVTATNGILSASQGVDLDVVNQPTPSTEVSGQVVDESGVPLVGIPVMIGALGAKTDALGRFTIAGVPDRPGPLMIDGPDADAAGTYMMLMAPTSQFLGHPAYAKVNNVVAQPMIPPKVDLVDATDFSKVDASKQLDLTSPLLPGVVLHVAAGSAMTMDRKAFTGMLALTQLPVADLREVMPAGVSPGSLVGVDGRELMFKTAATITEPNTVGYAPGSMLSLLSMNMITGGFDVTGHLKVTDDGKSLVTVDGGIFSSSCLSVVARPPGQGDPSSKCLGCEVDANSLSGNDPGGRSAAPPHPGPSGHPLASDVGLVTGTYYQDHQTAGYMSQGQERGVDLQYSSVQSNPKPLVEFRPKTQPTSNSGSIRMITGETFIGGVTRGKVTFSTSGLGDNQPYRVPEQVDGTPLGTGVYPISMAVTQTFGSTGATSLTTNYASSVNVVNKGSDPFGAGWSIGGLQRVYAPSSAMGPALITAGSQGTEKYGYRPSGPIADLALVTGGGSASGGGTSGGGLVLPNDGMGDFTAANAPAGSNPTSVFSADFNGDGRPDLAEAIGNTLSILLNNGSGGFTAGSSYAMSANIGAVVAGNFTGHSNATLDLAVLRGDGTVAVLPGQGDGTFGTATVTTVGGGPVYQAESMAVGDFNGDGKADLAVASTGDGQLRVLLGNGSAGFAPAVAYALPGNAAAVSVATCDYNADGKTDLVVVGQDSTATYYLMTGNGLGGFSQTSSFAGSDYAQGSGPLLAVGDFYGTGGVEAAYAGYTSPVLSIVPVDANGVWGAETLYNLNGTTTNLTTADLNGDGRPDLVAASSGALSLLLSNPDANQLEATQTIPIGGPAWVAAAPFTGRSLGARYAGPMGDTSTLAPGAGGTWTRSYTDGTVLRFDSLGRETSETDRNGNATTYAYVSGGAADALQSITDPVGQVTTLGYDASGHLSTITDPAGRVTTITVDSNGNLTQVVDPDGAVTGYGYATPSNHAITTEINPDSKTATAHYDASGRFLSETLFDGTSTTLVSSAEQQGLIAPGMSGPLSLPGNFTGTLTDPNGHFTQLTFDAMGHPIAMTDANGQTTTYVRDMNGWVSSETDPWTTGQTRTTSYQYDPRGNVTRVTRPDARSMTIAYDPTYSVPTQMTDDKNQVTTFALDGHGNVLRRTDPDLLSESFTYDAAGQVITDTDRNGHTTTYHYDALGRPDRITYPGSTNPSVGLTYDAAGEVIAQTDELGQTTTMTYDPAGRLLSTTAPDRAIQVVQAGGSGFSTVGPWNLYPGFGHGGSLDEEATTGDGSSKADFSFAGLVAGQQYLVEVTWPAYPNRATNAPYSVSDGSATLGTATINQQAPPTGDSDPSGTAWQALGTFSTSSGRLVVELSSLANGRVEADAVRIVPLLATAATRYVYDPAGNLLSITDTLGRLTSYAYDARNRRISMVDPANQHTGRQTTYAYDGMDLASVTDPLGHKVSYAYDHDDRLLTTTDALNHVTATAYDAAGEATSTTDANLNATSSTYDSLGRLATETLPGTPTVRYTFAYDPDGNLTSITDALNHVISYGYDALNRKTSMTLSPDIYTSLTTAYAYDPVGNLTSVTDPLNHATTFAYDARDRMTSQTAPAGGGTTSYTYDDHSRLLTLTDPVNNVTAYRYDNDDRVTSVTDPRSKITTTLYNLVGDPTQVTDRIGRVRRFGYDANDRPTTESWLPAGGGTPLDTFTTTYDAAGRVTSLGDSASQSAYAYDDANRLTSINNAGTPGVPQVTLTDGYDAAGNRTSLSDSLGGQYSYGYNARNQLTSLSQSGTSGVAPEMVQITYDAAQRITGLTRYADLAGTQVVAKTASAYDAANRLTSLTHQTAGGATIASYGYTLDAADRLTSLAHAWNGGSATDTVAYGYTNNNQLTSVVHSNASFANESFSFDANGNRNAVAVHGRGRWVV